MVFGGRHGQFLCPVQMACTDRVFPDLQPFEYFSLQCGSQTLDLLEPVFAGGSGERLEIGDPKLLI